MLICSAIFSLLQTVSVMSLASLVSPAESPELLTSAAMSLESWPFPSSGIEFADQ